MRSKNMFDTIGNLSETLNLDLKEDYSRKLGVLRVSNLDTDEVQESTIMYYADDELEDLLEDVKEEIREKVLEISSQLVFSNFLYAEDPMIKFDLIDTHNVTTNLYKGKVSGLKAYFRGDAFDKAILTVPEIAAWGNFDKRSDNIGVKVVEAEADVYKNKMNAIIDCYINGKPEKIYIDIDSFYDSIINKYEYRSVDADYLGLEIGDVLDKVDEKIEDYLETKYPDTFTSKDLKKIYDQVNDDLSNDIMEELDNRDYAMDYDLSGDLDECQLSKQSFKEDWDPMRDKLGIEIEKAAQDDNIYVDFIDSHNSVMGSFTLTFRIDNGDWKHDHLAFDQEVYKYFEGNKDYSVWKINNEEIGSSDSDNYSSYHKVFIIPNDRREVLNSMKGLFEKRGSKVSEAFDDDDFEVSEQEFSSAETANGNAKANGGLGRVPALFTKIKYPAKGLVFDYGCGKESTVQQITNYLKSQNIDYAGYDKFNRSASENSEVLKKVRAAGGADIATSANVLNVIKEKDVRVNEVIRNMYKLLKSGGVAYFDVYSDKKKEGPKQTGKDKWQEFRGIDTYVDEVAEIFGKDNVQLKGSIIIAKK